MAKLFVGCSGFTYAHWRGPFYPENIPQHQWFHYYTQHFTTVELNVTFYHLPKPETFHKWYLDSPTDFSFAVKGSRYISHIKKLADPEEGVERFFAAAQHLRDKLKVVLWQFPPSWSINVQRLEEFLKVLDRFDVRNTFEFRNESWITPEVKELCRSHNASLCMADWPEYIADLEPTADFVYFRRHGHGTYDGKYSTDFLRNDAARLKAYLDQGKDAFIFFNNDISAFAPANATELLELIR